MVKFREDSVWEQHKARRIREMKARHLTYMQNYNKGWYRYDKWINNKLKVNPNDDIIRNGGRND